MKKKTIKELEANIERLESDKSHWYNKFTELKNENDNKRNNEILVLRNEKEQLVEQVANLLEIIRWHINPTTAESPFLPTKNQREDRKNY